MIRKPLRSLAHARTRATLAACVAVAIAAMSPAWAWEPTKPVEFVVPAGTGGGADQMARLIQGIVIKHKLMKEPMIVVNKSAGAGAEGFLEIKGAKGQTYALPTTWNRICRICENVY